MMNKNFYLSLLIFMTLTTVHAQEFTIRKIEMAGDKLLLHYDLVDTIKNRHYTVSLYSSKDNFLQPLQKVSGDAGLEVVPGKNHKIIWAAKEELGNEFDGKVALEVRGRLYIPFVRFKGFEDYKVVKRGKPYILTWTGGSRQNILNFELYRDNQKIWAQPPVANTGSHEIVIPTSVKPGTNYRFKITDTKNKDEIVNTGLFKIKRKIPLGMKIVPLLVAGGVIYWLSQNDKTDEIADPLVPTDKDKN
jgi:hypothetical protein